MRLKTGWLSPSAELIRCDYMSHSATATEIVEKLNAKHDYSMADDDFLLQIGYAKIGFNMLGKQEYYIIFEKSLTDMQIKYIQNIIENESKLDFPLGYLTKMGFEKYLDTNII